MVSSQKDNYFCHFIKHCLSRKSFSSYKACFVLYVCIKDKCLVSQLDDVPLGGEYYLVQGKLGWGYFIVNWLSWQGHLQELKQNYLLFHLIVRIIPLISSCGFEVLVLLKVMLGLGLTLLGLLRLFFRLQLRSGMCWSLCLLTFVARKYVMNVGVVALFKENLI